MEARAQSITLFAVGVGSEIATSELVSIANKPTSAYVLFAEDYTNIDRIRDSMEQKLCEGQNISPSRCCRRPSAVITSPLRRLSRVCVSLKNPSGVSG